MNRIRSRILALAYFSAMVALGCQVKPPPVPSPAPAPVPSPCPDRKCPKGGNQPPCCPNCPFSRDAKRSAPAPIDQCPNCPKPASPQPAIDAPLSASPATPNRVAPRFPLAPWNWLRPWWTVHRVR
jgi:hypothetical protein